MFRNTYCFKNRSKLKKNKTKLRESEEVWKEREQSMSHDMHASMCKTFDLLLQKYRHQLSMMTICDNK